MQRWTSHRSELDAALRRIETLLRAKRGTAEGNRLDVLVTLVEAWERRHYPLDLPDPVEAIKYHMDWTLKSPKVLTVRLAATEWFS
jgi:HTH-type transcriptional regulator / antitoxin HigA